MNDNEYVLTSVNEDGEIEIMDISMDGLIIDTISEDGSVNTVL